MEWHRLRRFPGRMSKSAAGREAGARIQELGSSSQEQQTKPKPSQMNLWWTGYQQREQLRTRNKSNRIQRMVFLRILFTCAGHKQPKAVGDGMHC